MSYDITIWMTETPNLDEVLSKFEGWERIGEDVVFARRGWQILLFSPLKVEMEDIPNDVFPQMPGIKYVIDIHLEPLGAPKTGYQLLNKICKAISRQSNGVVYDAQTDTVETASGVKRYVPTKRDPVFSILEMSWWFNEGPLLSPDSLRNFLDVLEKFVPESLPRRYGLYEPPQFKLAETGIEHLHNFLLESPSSLIVWYPTRPATDVSFVLDKDWGPKWQGFRANTVSMSFEASVLSDPKWSAHLCSLWKHLTTIIQPFYGDVRILRGYSGSRTLWTHRDTESHPVKLCWWRGIPSSQGLAVCVGGPYLDCWPALSSVTNICNGIRAYSIDDWHSGRLVTDDLGPVPIELVQPPTNYDPVTGSEEKSYPVFWPFSGPYSKDT